MKAQSALQLPRLVLCQAVSIEPKRRSGFQHVLRNSANCKGRNRKSIKAIDVQERHAVDGAERPHHLLENAAFDDFAAQGGPKLCGASATPSIFVAQMFFIFPMRTIQCEALLLCQHKSVELQLRLQMRLPSNGWGQLRAGMRERLRNRSRAGTSNNGTCAPA